MSTIDFNTTELSISRLIKDKTSGKIKIPEHQRNANVWTDDNRAKFVDSCKKAIPFPNILFFEDDFQTLWIEDGLQRITTLEKFINGEFKDTDSQTYSEWSEVQQTKFLAYRVPVLTYSGATDIERVEIFDRFQNGSPLKVGERLHSLSYTPLVSFTKKMFFSFKNEDGETTTGHLVDRAIRHWGVFKTGDKDKRNNELLKMVALVNGAAHGFGGGGISKKLNDLRTNLFTPIDETATVAVLNEVFDIFEETNQKKPVSGKTIQGVQKEIGNFVGPIVYSLKRFPTEWERLRAGWVAFLVRYRQNNTLLKEELLLNLDGARSWNTARWRLSYDNVFNIPNVQPILETESIVSGETSDDDDN